MRGTSAVTVQTTETDTSPRSISNTTSGCSPRMYTTQPMEVQNLKALECTFQVINAETQLMYASDYPHWDFDLPSTIYDLPFLSEKPKHNILGGTAARLFGLKPRSKTQEDQLRKFGNIVA